MVHYSNLDKIEQEEISQQLKRTREFSCVIPYSNLQSEQFLSNALSTVLLLLNKTGLFTYLEYCLKEMVMNASKANSKRVYFREKGLKITDPGDYEKGMRSFKNDVFGNFSEYEQKHQDLNSVVKVQFKISNDSFYVHVLNNSILNQEEKERISGRLKIADKFNTMAEVLMHGFDETEGAGFGLIIIILMLRKINLDERAFAIKETEKYTICSLKIPLQLISREHGEIIAREISDEIDKMPQFPEGILRLQKELGNPNSDFQSLADIIKHDSALTTEILRTANSPIYALPQQVEDVVKAVKLIGVTGVRNLVLSFGVNRVFEKKYNREQIESVMEHSYEVAVFCTKIAKLKKLASLREDIYVAALLHDMGKIVVNSLQPQLAEKLRKVCFSKHIPINTLESLTDGYNHSLIGALLAEKWNFPPRLTESIKYHHIPLEAAEENRTILCIIYIGNELSHYYRGERRYEELNYKVLKFLGIEKQEKFMDLAKQVDAARQ